MILQLIDVCKISVGLVPGHQAASSQATKRPGDMGTYIKGNVDSLGVVVVKELHDVQ